MRQDNTKENKMSCNIKSPPSQVKMLHKEIIEKMKSTFSDNGCELVEDGEGPTLVTVVNASRTLSDIKRDMEAAKLTSSESSSVILLRIVPTRDPNQKVEKQQSENFILDLPFLMDQDRKLFDCSHNTEQFE